MDNILEEKAPNEGFSEDFESWFKLFDEWRLKIETVKRFATEKLIEEKKHFQERLEKASAMSEKLVSQNGCEFFSGICEREKMAAKERLDSLSNSEKLPLKIKEINAGFEKLCASLKEKYRQASSQLKVASDGALKSKNTFKQKNLEWRKSTLSRTNSVNGDPQIHSPSIRAGELTLKQRKIQKKLKELEKECEHRTNEANAKDFDLERLKDEIAEKIREHMEKTERSLNEILGLILNKLHSSQKSSEVSVESNHCKSDLVQRLEKFRTRERSREPRFTFNPNEEITRTFSPPMLRRTSRKSSEPILDSWKSDWTTKNMRAERNSWRGWEKTRNSTIGFSELDDDMKIKMIKMSLNHVDSHGLNREGIYRKSGSEVKFREISEKMLSSDGDDCDEIFEEMDIYTIAKYTKNLLMQANELLFTKEVKQEMFKIFKPPSGDKMSDSMLEELKECLKKLPSKNETLLMMVFQHLNKVATKSDANKMDALNLAMIFSPALFNYKMDGTVNAQLTTWPKATEVFIKNYRFLFDLEPSNDQNLNNTTEDNNNKSASTQDDVFQESDSSSESLSPISEKTAC